MNLESRLNALERVFAPPEKFGTLFIVYKSGDEKAASVTECLSAACSNDDSIARFVARPQNGMIEWTNLFNALLNSP